MRTTLTLPSGKVLPKVPSQQRTAEALAQRIRTERFERIPTRFEHALRPYTLR